MTNIAMENPTISKFGKPSISMGHGLTMAMSAITRGYNWGDTTTLMVGTPVRHRHRPAQKALGRPHLAICGPALSMERRAWKRSSSSVSKA